MAPIPPVSLFLGTDFIFYLDLNPLNLLLLYN